MASSSEATGQKQLCVETEARLRGEEVGTTDVVGLNGRSEVATRRCAGSKQGGARWMDGWIVAWADR